MKVKSIKKNCLKNHSRRFTLECTPYGSLISSLLLVSNQKWSDAKYVSKLDKAKFPFLDEEDFVGKTLRAVGLSIDDFKKLEAAGAVFIPSTGLGKFFEYKSNNYKHTVYDYGAGGSQYFVKDHNYYTTTPQGVPDGISRAKVYLVWDKYATTRSIDYRRAGTSAKTGENSYISSVRLIQKHK